MVALPLFDVVLSADDGTTRPLKVAAELVQSALEEIRHIKNLDENLAPADPSHFDCQTVALIRRMYEDWARSVEELLDRVAQLDRRLGTVANIGSLRDSYGRTRAMLSIPLERLQRDNLTVATARGLSTEEARRELRLGNH